MSSIYAILKGTPCSMERLFLVVVLASFLHFGDGFNREKRQLVFPPQSIMQLAFGVVTPAQVQNRQIATNMGIMFNIDLPTNMSVWYPWKTDYRRKRSADTDQSFYNLLESAFSMSGMDGKSCIQKSVCQMKETPIQSDNMLIQILNLVFGYDQNHLQTLWDPKHYNRSCDQMFPTCQHSPVDLFFQLVTSTWTSSE